MRKRIVTRCIVWMTACGTLFVIACDTPDAVAKFCSSAVTTLNAGNAIFDDMKASCLREVNSRTKLAAFEPKQDSSQPCDDIGEQADGAKAANGVLAAYFSAIDALASFDTAKVGSDAHDLVSKASEVAKLPAASKTALGAIGKFLISAATGSYRQRQLERDLPAVSGNVNDVIAGLSSIVTNDYGLLLKSEEQKLSVRYREFLHDNSKPTPLSVETQLSLYERWKAEDDAIDTRRTAADKYVVGLKTISTGLSELAANANHLTAKELVGLLEPYVTELQTLIPAIQKAF